MCDVVCSTDCVQKYLLFNNQQISLLKSNALRKKIYRQQFSLFLRSGYVRKEELTLHLRYLSISKHLLCIHRWKKGPILASFWALFKNEIFKLSQKSCFVALNM